MARIRTLKPEMASDAKLAKVSRDARYTFVLLITQADDEGLVAAAHRQLLGQLYPLDEQVSAAMLLEWIEELVGIDVLRWRATRDGAPVLELVNWSRHQRVDNKGRSQLALSLVPVEETPPPPADPRGDSRNLAANRGDSPQLAESRGLDLGPRTKDRGPTTKGKRRGEPRTLVPTPDEAAVIAHHLGRHPRRQPPEDKVLRLLRRALSSGYDVPTLCLAVDANADDDWCKETGNQGLGYVLRDRETIDRFAEKGRAAKVPLVNDAGELTEAGLRLLRTGS